MPSSTEIVISYSGTDPEAGLSSGDWQTNFALLNGNWADQLLQAAEYYLQIRQVNPSQSTTFTLTGHSLGGGLAALVSVFFNVPAVAFDQAPFAKSATSLSDNATTLLSHLSAKGYSAVALAPLAEYIQTRGPGGDIPRASLVSTVRVDGEFLGNGPISGIGYKAIGSSAPTVLTHGPYSSPSTDMHSQALLTAFLASDLTASTGGDPQQTHSFSEVTKKLHDLLPMLFSRALFTHSTAPGTNAQANFLDHLVRHEIGIAGSFAADAMVTRFTADLWKLAQDGGLTLSEPNLTKTLMAFAMQKYYDEDLNGPSYNQHLFTELAAPGVGAGSGGIRFDMAHVTDNFAVALSAGQALNLADAKGYGLYFKSFLAQATFSSAERSQITTALPQLRDWYVQAGASGMTATDNLGRNAFMLGGTGQDTLTGATGADLLVGNAGDDVLQGGPGNDTLLGGTGTDTYTYISGQGRDTITDNGGAGSIVVDGIVLTGGPQLGDASVHRSTDGKHIYVQVDAKTLLIDGNLIVNDYTQVATAGALGLNMTGPAAAPQNPTTTSTITGDLTPVDIDPNTAGVQSQTDALGNIITNPNVPEPNRVDILFDSNANDSILAGGGDDRVLANGLGDDVIDAGAGRDDVYGGVGNDVISGGTGADILDGWTGNDLLFADGQVSIATAFANGNSQTGTALQGDWLAGGAGDDTLVGSTSKDVLTGGGGADLLFGGAGDDDLIGDADWVAANFNWTVEDRPDDRFFSPVTGTQFPLDDGADVIYCGLGNDHAWGGIGNDVLFGEGGNDWLYGEGGNDVLMGGANNDTLDGGDGLDYLNGGAGNDVLYGEAGDDTLDGGGGTYDQLRGGSGNNTFKAAALTNDLYGGAGNDTYLLTAGTSSNIFDGQGINNYIFGTGVVNGAQQLSSAMNSDTLELNFGSGTALRLVDSGYTAGTGLNVQALLGGGVFEFSNGQSIASKTMLSYSIAIAGSTGNDSVLGTLGGDRITGGTGADTLRGAAGADSLDGGAGDDLYKFEIHDGQDRITDIQGVNTLEFGVGITTSSIALVSHAADLLVHISNSGDQVVLVNWNTTASVSTIRFASGATWNRAQMQSSITSNAVTVAGGESDDQLLDGPGNDVLGGGGGDDRMYANAGNDTLDGGSGNDQLDAGFGNNVYLFGVGSGQDRIINFAVDSTPGKSNTLKFKDGVAPFDVVLRQLNANSIPGSTLRDLEVSIDHSGDKVSIKEFFNQNNPAAIDNPIQRFEFADGASWNLSDILAALYAGTSDNDVLYGTVAGESIQGGFGDDTLYGGDGSDTLVGGSGNDVVDGDEGVDTADYNTSIDPVIVNLSVTTAQAVSIANGADIFLDIENLVGSAFNDSLTGDANANRLVGGTGNDVVSGNAGNDLLDAGDGNDTVGGSLGDDTVWGGNGDDSINGGQNNDYLDGGAGDDLFVAMAGDDTLVGDSGVDTANYGTATEAIVVNLNTTVAQTISASSGTDLLSGIENLIGSAFNDSLNGDANANRLDGLAGNDSVAGNSGNDYLDLGDGNDTAAGGMGDDTVVGGNGDDVLSAGQGNDFIDGGAGNDVGTGMIGNDTMLGGDGVDTANFGSSTDGVTVNLSVLTAQYISAVSGTDTLSGFENATGSPYADTLTGDANANQLEGLAGADTLTGGLGADNFRFGSPADGNDTITDFLVGVDKLVVASSSFGTLVLGVLGATQYVAGTAPTANQPFAQFLYSTTTGQMAFDADGTGAASAVNIVTLLGLPALSAGDIWIGA